MPDVEPAAVIRFTIFCRRCERPVLARAAWVGREVRCPHCFSPMRVPEMPPDRRPVPADPPHLGACQGFNFPCPRCDCLLEAHTGMCGQHGRCPTCGAQFLVPFLHPSSGRPEKAPLLEGAADMPTPVHAYAASGCQAPQIIQAADGSRAIQCPRCNALSPIDADNCAACNTPFTIEAAATMGKLHRDTQATAALGLGIVGLVLFFLVLPGVVAVWLGLRSMMYSGPGRRSTLGVAGLALGLLGLAGGLVFWYFRLK